MDRSKKPTISGPLQEKIMILLRERPMCGKDLMKELGIKSPGTIYPALEELKKKKLVDVHLEITGAIRKKIYNLTPNGKDHLHESMTSSAKMFCCDPSLYVETILRDMRGMVDIRKHQKILSTLDFADLRGSLNGADVTFESDAGKISGKYDVILTFTGMGCLIGTAQKDLEKYFTALRPMLRKEGRLLVVEIERTDNIFVRILFDDIRKSSKQPGMSPKELESILSMAGFDDVAVIPKSGLLYGLARSS
jgi:DNA-binding PadR family transcriptional regulator